MAIYIVYCSQVHDVARLFNELDRNINAMDKFVGISGIRKFSFFDISMLVKKIIELDKEGYYTVIET
jgi:hypothetical protein